MACLKAGINQFLDKYADETKAALKQGLVSEKEIDDLLRPKFRVTIRLGLLDPAEMVPYSTIKDSPEPWNSEKDKAVSEKMALESVVLLKNDKSFLPLKKDSIKSIAVIGPLADSVHWDWYGGTPPHLVTPLQGIKDAVGPDVKVKYAADEDGQAAVIAARISDVAVVVIGNDPTCGPDMPHDWHDTVGRRRHAGLHGAQRRSRRARSREHHAGSGAAGKAGVCGEPEDGSDPGLELSVCHQLVAGARACDSAYDALVTGRGNGAGQGTVWRL